MALLDSHQLASSVFVAGRLMDCTGSREEPNNGKGILILLGRRATQKIVVVFSDKTWPIPDDEKNNGGQLEPPSHERRSWTASIVFSWK